MEKKKSKGKLIALIIAIVVVVGVVATGIVLAAYRYTIWFDKGEGI